MINFDLLSLIVPTRNLLGKTGVVKHRRQMKQTLDTIFKVKSQINKVRCVLFHLKVFMLWFHSCLVYLVYLLILFSQSVSLT